MDFFYYNSYTELLIEYFVNGKFKVSKAQIAKSCHCQPSYLSRVLSGKAHLAHEQAISLCSNFKLSEKKTKFFLLLIDYQRSGTEQAKLFYKSQIEQIREEQSNLSKRFSVSDLNRSADQSLYYSSWYWAAIHILSSVERIKDPEDIADRLALPLELVENCLSDLENMQLIKRSTEGFFNLNKMIHLPRESHLNAINHSNWRQRAILNAQTHPEKSVHYSSVQSISKKDFLSLKKLILKTIDESRGIVTNSGKEDIVCLNCDLFFV